MQKRTISLLIAMFPLLLLSQVTNEVWTDYIHTHYLNKKWVVFGDATFRVGNSTIIGIRPSVKYFISNKVQLRAGVGNNYTFKDKDNLSNIEIRPWQGVRAVWPSNTIFALQHYVRLEEQFTTNSYIDAEFKGSVRFRYQIGSDIDIWEDPSGSHLLKMPLEYEIFHTFNQKSFFVERDRFIIGLSYSIHSSLAIEINYILQRHGEGLSNMSTDKNIYRIRLRQTFSEKIKKQPPTE